MRYMTNEFLHSIQRTISSENAHLRYGLRRMTLLAKVKNDHDLEYLHNLINTVNWLYLPISMSLDETFLKNPMFPHFPIKSLCGQI